jgi:hypothetical protein
MNFYAKFFYFAFASLLIVLLFQKKLILNRTSLIYFLLCAVMSIYNRSEGLLSMIRCFANVSLYLVGYNMLSVNVAKKAKLFTYDKETVQKKGFALLLTIALGSFAHYALNFLYNFNNVLSRNTNDIWTHEAMAATGQATLACIMLGLSVAMIYLPQKQMYRYFGILAITAILGYNLILAGRTIIVITVFLFAMGLFYVRRTLNTSTEKFKFVSGIVVFLLVAFLLIGLNVGGIQDYILKSNLFERFGNSLSSFTGDATRADNKVLFASSMLKYPFGGLHMRQQYGYAHDLLLDGYDEYGVLGFLPLVAILVFGIVELIKLLKNVNYDHKFKLSVLCVYVAVLLEFCVEPILAGMPWLFACFCLVNGSLAAINSFVFEQCGEMTSDESTAN